MFTQKLFKNGNSVVLTIPQKFLIDLNLKEGEEVVVEKNKATLVIASKKSQIASDVDAKFMKMVDDFINEHQDVLSELSKR